MWIEVSNERGVDLLTYTIFICQSPSLFWRKGKRKPKVPRTWRGQANAPTDRWRNIFIVSSWGFLRQQLLDKKMVGNSSLASKI